jgi:hypothetical protein
MKSLKTLTKNSPILFFSIFSLLGCIALNIGIFREYAFADSYEFIWLAKTSPTFQHEFIRGGRPLYGLLNQLAFGTFSETISDLKWLRFFSLVGSVILSIQIFKFLLKLNMKVLEAALFSFLIFTLPSFSLIIGWSSTYQIPWALNISFYAGLILYQTLQDKKINILKYLSAVLLVIISLCFYQAAGTAFLIPFVFSAVLLKQIETSKLIHLIAFLSISFVLYFIVFKLNIAWHGIEPFGRTKLNIFKFPFRYLLFYIRELKTLIQASGIIIAPYFFLFIGCFLFLGFFFMQKKNSQKPNANLFLIFLLAVLPLSYLPNLISSDNWKCSRTIVPAAILVLFYQFYYLKQLSKKIKLIKPLSLALSVSLLTTSYINLNSYISDIQVRELKALKIAFNKISLTNTNKIIFIIPERTFLLDFEYYKKSYADEFIQISSSRLWMASPLLHQLQTEKAHREGSQKDFEADYNVKIHDINMPYETSNNNQVINIINILKNEFSK